MEALNNEELLANAEQMQKEEQERMEMEERLKLESEMRDAEREMLFALAKSMEKNEPSAKHYVELKNKYDSIGKVIQTLTGNGTMADPFKGWKVGMSVEAGMWYYVDDPNDHDNPYLWEAIKSGVPASEVDAEYFDVVGV